MDENKLENEEASSSDTSNQGKDYTKLILIIVIATTVFVVTAGGLLVFFKNNKTKNVTAINPTPIVTAEKTHSKAVEKNSSEATAKPSATPKSTNSPSGFVQKKEPKASTAEQNVEVMPGKSPKYVKTKLGYEQVSALVQEVADQDFGKNATVFSLEKAAIEFEVLGKKRSCYTFAADKAGKTDGEFNGIYYVDGNTGEVFKEEPGGTKKVR